MSYYKHLLNTEIQLGFEYRYSYDISVFGRGMLVIHVMIWALYHTSTEHIAASTLILGMDN